MSAKWLPCGTYHENYTQDHALWQTHFVRGKMILLAVVLWGVIPYFADD